MEDVLKKYIRDLMTNLKLIIKHKLYKENNRNKIS